jgi:gas vesicle protein
MCSITTRRLVAGFTAGVAAVAASAVLLLAPTAADAGHSLSRMASSQTLGHSL